VAEGVILFGIPWMVLAHAKSFKYPPLLIGPGDLLKITVYNHSSNYVSNTSKAFLSASSPIPTHYLVDYNGKIFFPFIGSVKISGLSQIQASLFLMKKLSPFLKFPQVTVLIEKSNSYNIAVLGDVTHPGQYMIRGQPTLLSMLAEAGGPAPTANLGNAVLIHGTHKTLINLNLYLNDTHYLGKQPEVYPGDILFIPKSPWPSLTTLAILASVLSSASIIYATLHH
jgi:polysaccharide export outer membrane protein